jgi:hypothetical protein
MMVLLTFNMRSKLTELVRYDDGSYALVQDGSPLPEHRWAAGELDEAINMIIRCVKGMDARSPVPGQN